MALQLISLSFVLKENHSGQLDTIVFWVFIMAVLIIPLYKIYEFFLSYKITDLFFGFQTNPTPSMLPRSHTIRATLFFSTPRYQLCWFPCNSRIYYIQPISMSLPMPFSWSIWNTFLLYPSWTFSPTTANKNPTYSLNLFLIISNIDFILLWDCIAYKLLSFIEHLLSARPIISTLHYNHRVITVTLILLKEKLKFRMVR